MRAIYCPNCASQFHIHPEDERDGWKMRKVNIKAKVPTDGSHRIEISVGFPGDNEPTDVIPVLMIVCDQCNDEIPEGADAVAVSMWRPGDEMTDWEKAYTL